MVFLLLELEKFLVETSRKNLPAPLKKAFGFIGDFLRYPEITRLMKVAKTKPKTIRAYKYDYLFRDKYKEASMQLIELVYEFDAYMSVAKTAEQKQLTFPEYIESDFPHLQLEGLYHPFIDQPVPNDLVLRDSQNLCFLSGPNMAGKSTFLKSLGLCVYLAHLGFPVPAQVMKTTVYKGLVTTINLPDDMGLGYSHFYSEVRRIKEVANTIKEKKSVFVIFDELFRGTNVKDALDASLLVIKSFAQIKRSTFFISTHITEIAEEITGYENIQFKLMDIKINNNKPIYSYKLLDGVSHERLGMWIVKNENIVEILDALK